MQGLDPRVWKTERVENEFDSRDYGSLRMVSPKSLGWEGSR